MFQIPRSEGYEKILDTLVSKITGIEHFKHHTGCSFSNDVFDISPYYFGKCICNYGREYNKFLESHPHKSDCFMIELQILNEEFKKHPQYKNNNKIKAIRANEEQRLCIAHKIDYDANKRLDNICNCGVDSEFEKLNIKHEDGCPIIKPNFWFKKEDIKIYWYKTYFRNAWSNVELNLDKFKNIIGICLSSL